MKILDKLKVQVPVEKVKDKRPSMVEDWFWNQKQDSMITLS
jgi:hypothetical protein